MSNLRQVARGNAARRSWRASIVEVEEECVCDGGLLCL